MSEAEQKAASAISEAAADWVVRMAAANVTAAEKSAFMEWLRQSPVHVREYLRAELVFAAMQGAAREDSSCVEALLAEAATNVVGLPDGDRKAASAAAMRSSQGQNSVHFGSVAVKKRGLGRWIQRKWWPKHPVPFIAAAALVLVALAVIFTLRLELHDPNVYTTTTGEQRRIILADGSAVDLNTRSSIRVELTSTSRHVYLTEGEAFFDVAKAANRPFRVISGNSVVRAVGTQFNVYHQPDETVITVVEGRVSVRELPSNVTNGNRAIGFRADLTESEMPETPEVELAAGHKLVVTSRIDLHAAAVPPSAANVDTATAWRQRRLIFEDQALADVIAEFNRYSRQQLVIEDAALAGERISGIFDADRPEDLLGFLVRNSEVQVSEDLRSRVILSSSRKRGEKTTR